MILFPADAEQTAKRVSTILAGSDPRTVEGRLLVAVPMDRLEAALLFSETEVRR